MARVTIFSVLTAARDQFRHYELEHENKAAGFDKAANVHDDKGDQVAAAMQDELSKVAREKARTNRTFADMTADMELADRIAKLIEDRFNETIAEQGPASSVKGVVQADGPLVTMLAEARARMNISDPLLRAQAEAAGSMMLDMQNEVIALRQAIAPIATAEFQEGESKDVVLVVMNRAEHAALLAAYRAPPMLHGIAEVIADVTEFHRAFDLKEWLPDGIQPLTEAEAETRAKWIKSEAVELVHDTAEYLWPDGGQRIDLMAKQADAFLDAIYFAAGGLIRMGLDTGPLWRIVHGANMAKRHTRKDGSLYVVKREGDGKVVKPEGWVDPHELIVAEIKRQMGVQG